jgi:hypothetical protein
LKGSLIFTYNNAVANAVKAQKNTEQLEIFKKEIINTIIKFM